MLVRPATHEDAELILQFINELAEYEKCLHEVEVTVEILRKQLALEAPPFGCLIVEEDLRPLGFALYFFGYSTWTGTRTLFLEDLYVTSTARGSGAGVSLMNALANIAVTNGCSRFEWNVLDWNRSAIDFYERIGAFPMDGWTRYRLAGDPLAILAHVECSPNTVLQIA